MRDLDTIALFTPKLRRPYNLNDRKTERIAVRGLMCAFKEVKLNIQWVHIAHRDIPNPYISAESSDRMYGCTYRAVEAEDAGKRHLRAEAVAHLPEDVFETRCKLGADFVLSYDGYEEAYLGELSVTPTMLTAHTKTRLERRAKEERLARNRKACRQRMLLKQRQRMPRQQPISDKYDFRPRKTE